jgi:hypothetical protein
MPPGPLPYNAQNLVILNRVARGLGEGAVKDLLVCHGNGSRPAPLPWFPPDLVIPNADLINWAQCVDDIWI